MLTQNRSRGIREGLSGIHKTAGLPITAKREGKEMTKLRFQIAPDVEFKLDLEVEGITSDSRDYDVQQHKAEVYQEFERRLKQVFPEGVKIDRFDFGLSREKGD
jgi:hypothetical protein